MKVQDINLREMLTFKPETGRLLLGNDRMLIFRQEALSSLLGRTSAECCVDARPQHGGTLLA
jgi:hypothetical protein